MEEEQSIEEIKGNDLKETLIRRLEVLPIEIKKCSFKIFGFMNNLTVSRTDLLKIESEMMADISQEREMIVAYGKENEVKKYPNQEARNSELQKRLAKHPSYLEINKGMLFSETAL